MRNIVVSRGNHVGFLKRRCFTTKLEADKQGGDSLPFPCIYMLHVYRWPASLRRKPHARVQWRAASWRWRIRPGRVCDDARPDVAAVRRGCRACDDAAAAGRAVLRAARRTPCSAAAKRRLWRAGQRGPARHQCQNYAAGPGTLLACQSRTTRLKPACACDTDHARQTCNTCENACPVYPPATNTDHARQTCLCMQHGSRPSNQHARRITSVNCAEPPASLADTHFPLVEQKPLMNSQARKRAARNIQPQAEVRQQRARVWAALMQQEQECPRRIWRVQQETKRVRRHVAGCCFSSQLVLINVTECIEVSTET